MSTDKEFIVSALKYRPSDWDQVVGQSHITTTLKNAVAKEEIAKAYLFCGPRGVGKTTSARIFAKAINEKYLGEGEDLSFNVFELDAASNNSVDDIRHLIDQVRIQPPAGKYKVYIIDEVHMLSTQAFNAFLKTLEEPPPHAIFVLATTEKHKVIPTILSRCQIYDFARIQVPAMTAHLASIANDQEVSFEEEALHLIAQKADGALRDALSLFDQMVSFSGKHLTYTGVAENLNILDHDYYFRLCNHVQQGDVRGALLVYDEIVKHGFDSLLFITGLAAHLRDLLVAQDTATLTLLDTTDGVRNKYVAQSKAFDSAALIAFLEILQKAETSYRASQNKRLLTEVALMKMCRHQGLSEVNHPTPVAIEEKKTPVVSTHPLKSDEPKTAKAVASPIKEVAVEPSPTTTKIEVETPLVVEAAPLPLAEEPKAVIETPELRAESLSTPIAEALVNTRPEGELSNSLSQNEPQTEKQVPLPPRTLSVEPEEQIESPESVKEAEAPVIVTEVSQAAGDMPSAEVAVDPVVQDPASPPLDKLNPAAATAPSRTKRRKSKSISIVDFDQKQEEDVEEEEVEAEAGDALQESSLLKAWKEYANIIKEQKKFSFHSTLSNRIPKIVDANTLQISLENEVQMDDLTLERTALMTFIREKLNNPAIKLQADIIEDDVVENIGFKRPRDQFMHMINKNPNLKELAKRLDLEPEG